MRKYVFECAEWELTGDLGWKPVWMPNGDPLGPMAVAHDVLEHQRGTDGSVNEEFHALGAILFTRGDGGYFYRKTPFNPNWYNHVSGDVSFMLEKCLSQETDDWVKVTGSRAGTKLLDYYESDIDRAIKEILEDCNARIDENDYEGYDRQSVIDQYLSPAILEQMRRLFRQGYRWAERRYWDACKMSHVFTEIEDAAKKYLDNANEGDKLTVHFDLKHLKAHCTYKSLWGRYD